MATPQEKRTILNSSNGSPVPMKYLNRDNRIVELTFLTILPRGMGYRNTLQNIRDLWRTKKLVGGWSQACVQEANSIQDEEERNQFLNKCYRRINPRNIVTMEVNGEKFDFRIDNSTFNISADRGLDHKRGGHIDPVGSGADDSSEDAGAISSRDV